MSHVIYISIIILLLAVVVGQALRIRRLREDLEQAHLGEFYNRMRQ